MSIIRHGWRYLHLRPEHILRMTHKEFFIISEESVERTHDENERMAMSALFNAVASRGKGKKGKLPRLDELYDRHQISVSDSKGDVDDKFERHQAAQDWLTNFDLGALKDKDKQDEKEGGN